MSDATAIDDPLSLERQLCFAVYAAAHAYGRFYKPLLDPLGTLVHDANGRDVEHVWIQGRQLVAGGRAVLVDEARVIAEAQAVAEDLWARAAAHA